jgi:hypothetical protein
MSDLIFTAQFIATKVGLNGLAPVWDIDRVTRSTGARSALATGEATNVVYGRRGLYGYRLTGADLSLYDYIATAITADATVDQQELAAVWTLWSLSWRDILTAALTAVGSIGKLLVDNINATIGSRATQADILSDATPFPGAYIDAAVSTRALPVTPMVIP